MRKPKDKTGRMSAGLERLPSLPSLYQQVAS